MLTAGAAHKSQFKSMNAELEDDTPTDDEDTGEIHYIPPEEFDGYEIVDEHSAGPSHQGQLYTIPSESPRIRVNLKRPLDDFEEYDHQHEANASSEIEDFTMDDPTPRPSRPLPPRPRPHSPHTRTVASIPLCQPTFAPAARSANRQQEAEQLPNGEVKRRRVAFSEDDARDARHQLESIAARRREAPAGRFHQELQHMDTPSHQCVPVGDPHRDSADSLRYDAGDQPTSVSVLSPQPPDVSHQPRSHMSSRGNRPDFPSTLTPELFEEARQARRAKQALLDQQRSAPSQPGPLGSQHRHATQPVQSQQPRVYATASRPPQPQVHHIDLGLQQPRTCNPAAPGSHTQYPVASGSRQPCDSCPVASADVFYSPTHAHPPPVAVFQMGIPL